jgi:hypothetical protein
VGGETTLLPEDAKTTRLRKRKLQKAMSAAAEVKSAIANITSSDGSSSINNEKNSASRLERLQTTLHSIEENIESMEEESATKQAFPVKPKCGRIFFFPHECPHEGLPTVSVPKIFLRAELILKSKS